MQRARNIQKSQEMQQLELVPAHRSLHIQIVSFPVCALLTLRVPGRRLAEHSYQARTILSKNFDLTTARQFTDSIDVFQCHADEVCSINDRLPAILALVK
jgi:hypothetical protein